MLADAGCLDDVCACIQRGQLGTGGRAGGLVRSFLPPLGKRRVGGSYSMASIEGAVPSASPL